MGFWKKEKYVNRSGLRRGGDVEIMLTEIQTIINAIMHLFIDMALAMVFLLEISFFVWVFTEGLK